MTARLGLCLILLTLNCLASTAEPAKIALHVVPAGRESNCDRDLSLDAPCSEFNTHGELLYPYHVYIVAVSEQGIWSAQLGIGYDALQNRGLDIDGWCYATHYTLSHAGPFGYWPAGWSGITANWGACQDLSPPGHADEGVQTLIGSLDVYAFSADVLYVTASPRPDYAPPYWPVGNPWIEDCSYSYSTVPFTETGQASFGSLPGFNPCTGAGTWMPVPPSPDAPHSDPSVLLHIDPGPLRPFCSQGPPSPESAVTSAPIVDGTPYNVYLLGVPEHYGELPYGVAGLQLAIQYQPGIQMVGWTRCSDLDFPGDSWPAPGSGNTITWITDDCGSEPFSVAGTFQVLAYDPSLMWIDPYPATGMVKMVTCRGSNAVGPERTVDPAHLGWVSFGGGGVGSDVDGCNPLLSPCGVPGALPHLRYDPQSIEGAAMPGGEKRKVLVFCNDGAGPLGYSVETSEPWLSVYPASGTVLPGQCFQVTVYMSAMQLDAGDVSGTLHVLTSDPEHPDVSVPVLFHVALSEAVKVSVEPQSLNGNAGGPWIHAYLELAQGDDPASVVLETVRAAGTVPADLGDVQIGDTDHNGKPDLRLRFDRTALISALPPQDQVDIAITGEIRDLRYFHGADAVRLVRPHIHSPNGGETLLAGAMSSVTWDMDMNGTTAPDFARIRYSPDGGVSWVDVAEGSPSAILSWRVATEPSTTALVALHVYASGVLLGYDRSDATFTVGSATGIFENFGSKTSALVNAPNPFSRSTSIYYRLSVDAPVTLDIFDVNGRRVQRLQEGNKPEGIHQVEWDGRGDNGARVSAGFYIARLQAGDTVLSRRMLVLR